MRRTAFIFALFWEIRPFARRLKVPFFKTVNRQIIIKDRNIALVRCGMGKEKAMQAAEKIVKDFHPELIVSAGFCGALVGDLKVGDIVVSDLSDRKVFCSPHPLFTLEEKAAAYKEHQSLIVDMESEAVASVARKNNIGFLAVKAVSDSLTDDLPRSFFDFMSLSKILRLKRSLDGASGSLSEFLFDYINKREVQ